jgi:hypothetical protein
MLGWEPNTAHNYRKYGPGDVQEGTLLRSRETRMWCIESILTFQGFSGPMSLLPTIESPNSCPTLGETLSKKVLALSPL